MTTPRILQNFSGSRATVIATPGASVGTLERALMRLGLTVDLPAISTGQSFDVGSLQPGNGILFVDGDLIGAIDPSHGQLASVPVIGLVGVEAPSRLKALLSLGATAFIHKPVHGGAVYTALFLGINQFLQRRELRARLDDHQNRRLRRRVVVKAIVTMMEQMGIDDEEAYARLRRESMRSRCSLEDYCEWFVQDDVRPALGEEAGLRDG